MLHINGYVDWNWNKISISIRINLICYIMTSTRNLSRFKTNSDIARRFAISCNHQCIAYIYAYIFIGFYHNLYISAAYLSVAYGGKLSKYVGSEIWKTFQWRTVKLPRKHVGIEMGQANHNKMILLLLLVWLWIMDHSYCKCRVTLYVYINSCRGTCSRPDISPRSPHIAAPS